jgi:hypothetical protein
MIIRMTSTEKSMVDLHSLDDGSLHDLLIIVSDNDEHDKEVK